MEQLFHLTLQNRKNFLGILENTPKDILLEVPKGFRNNIWWNIAHVVVTQQLLVYNLSNVPMLVPQILIDKFRKGTVPDGTLQEEEMGQIASFLISTIETTQRDYKNGLFTQFNTYTTSTKFTLTNVEDAITFNIFHEGLHMGTIRAMNKLLG